MSAASEGGFLPGRTRAPERIVLQPYHVDELLDHARRGLPDEVCGFLAGLRETVEEIIPITNAEPSPVCYLMHSNEQFRAMKMMREKGLEMLGIYHSHPANPAFPSARDVEMASYPDCAYLIIGLHGPKVEMRGFRIEEGQVAEIPVTVSRETGKGRVR